LLALNAPRQIRKLLFLKDNNTMKTIFSKSAITLALLACTGAAQAAVQDVSVNGGFETGDFTGWVQYPGGGIQTIVTEPSAFGGGTYSMYSGVPVREVGAPAVDNVVKNANLGAGFLTPFSAITVSFDMKSELTGAGGVVFAELFSELTGGGVSDAQLLSGAPLSSNGLWNHYEFNTFLGSDVSGGVTLQLKTSCGPVVGCGVDAWFDNIQMVTESSAVPVPAAAWLFGSALLGLTGVARRKTA
jgi:hypothetical protein